MYGAPRSIQIFDKSIHVHMEALTRNARSRDAVLNTMGFYQEPQQRTRSRFCHFVQLSGRSEFSLRSWSSYLGTEASSHSDALALVVLYLE